MANLWGCFLLALLTLCVTAGSLNFTTPETSHTVLLPLERSFIFSIKFQNINEKDVLVNFISEPPETEDWLVILPTGRLLLSPGEAVEIIATFEPTYILDKPKGELNFNFKFEVNGTPYTIPLKVNYSLLDLASTPREKIELKSSMQKLSSHSLKLEFS